MDLRPDNEGHIPQEREACYRNLYQIREKQGAWISEILERSCDADITVIPVMHKDWLEVLVSGDDGWFYRFPISETDIWDSEMEERFRFFMRSGTAVCSVASLKKIFCRYRKDPGLGLRYYKEKPLLLLGHIYFCLHGRTPESVLFREGLGHLAMALDLIKGIDPSGQSPHEIFGGLGAATLSAFDSEEGAMLLESPESREKILAVQNAGSPMFEEKLNACQLKFLRTLLSDGEKDISLRYLQAKELLRSFGNDLERYERFTEYRQNCDALGRFFDMKKYRMPRRERFDRYSRKLGRCRLYLFDNPDCYNERVREMKEKYRGYEYSDGDYELILPGSADEICEEGISLDNFADSLVEEIEDGSVVMFLRRKSCPKSPFFTVELYGKTIYRAAGRNNQKPQRDVCYWLSGFAKKYHLENRCHAE